MRYTEFSSSISRVFYFDKLSLSLTRIIFMENNMKNLAQLLLVLMVLASTTAYAGTQILMQEFRSGKATKNTIIISVEGDWMRIDNGSKKKSKQDSQMVFNVSKKEMLVINHKKKTYNRMDEVFFKEVTQKMMKAKKLMDEQLARMPPEQQKMMGKMMGGAMGTETKKQSKFIKTSRRGKYAGFDCQVTEYLLDGKKHRELCLASIDDIKAAGNIFKALKGMSKMFKDLFQSISKALPVLSDSNPFHEIDKLDGFPIAITEFEKNKPGKSDELVSIKEKSFDKDFFAPPDGYKGKRLNLGR